MKYTVHGAHDPQRSIAASAIFGPHCVVWAFARVLDGCVIGEDVSIGAGTEIGHNSTIGDKTRIGANCFFPPRSTIGASVFVGPGVVCTDDRHPKILAPGESYTAQPPVIEDYVSIGAAAVLLPGVRIGHHARIAAGAIVAKDVEPFTLVRGERSRVVEPSADSVEWAHG